MTMGMKPTLRPKPARTLGKAHNPIRNGISAISEAIVRGGLIVIVTTASRGNPGRLVSLVSLVSRVPKGRKAKSAAAMIGSSGGAGAVAVGTGRTESEMVPGRRAALIVRRGRSDPSGRSVRNGQNGQSGRTGLSARTVNRSRALGTVSRLSWPENRLLVAAAETLG